MIYNFDELPARRETESIKWNFFDEDVLPMWVADMDFKSPEPVIRALQERVAQGYFGYAGQLKGLREGIVERLASKYNWFVQPEDLVFMPGVVTGFNMAGQAFAGQGKGVLIQPPVYMPFFGVANNINGIQQEAPLIRCADGSYEVDWDAFEAAITDQTGMFLLCNPHNPVGRVFRRDELERMAEICLRNHIIICSDEIHCDLIYSGHQHVPIASIDPEIAQHTVTLMAPSKTYNIAGLSCSFAVIQNAEMRKQFQNAHQGLVHGVNLLGLVAAKAAYCEGDEWLSQLLVYLEGNRDLTYDFVNEQMPGVSMARPEGTYLAWLDCREAGIEGRPCDFFIKNARVATNEGAAFGKGGEGFVRFNFGCPRPMLLEALERMKQALLQAGDPKTEA
ncbi:MAG: putative C-S lyase [Chloroflexi bacterium]|nr:putative C-S lyase [Chloroflexota bacterium]